MFRTVSVALLFLLSACAFGQQSEQVSLLCNWNDTAGLSNRNGQYFNDVWGFTWNKKEYAAIGSTEGVHIIDVNNCKQVAFYKGTSAGRHVVHRDYKVYKNYLYAVCDEGSDSRLQIFDLKYLPDFLHEVYVSPKQEIVTVHNIFIDTAKAKLYCGINTYGQPGTNMPVTEPMSVFSLEDPEHPVFLTHFQFPDYIHDVYVRNDTAYCSASLRGYVVADFSKDTSYDIIGILPSYDYKGYNHSSWINSKGIGVMADETHGMPMKVIDTREINNTEVRSYFMPRWLDSTCIPHNPYILNEDYVLISYYFDGLQIYNISNPDSPRRVGYYDTYPGNGVKGGFAGAWGCYPYLPSHRILVSDMQTGLYVLNADTALNLHIEQDTTVQPPVAMTFSLYPNPVKDVLKISLPETGDVTAAVYDIQGKYLLKQTIYIDPASSHGFELTLPRNCPMGMYTVRVIAGRSSYTGKFIKADN
jgi:choice-of-anchor B domain-containing protein